MAMPNYDHLARVGETFEKTVRLNRQEISDVATVLGDTNPLHHDEGYAGKTRFGSIIAAGPHVSSLHITMCADHFSKRGGMLGLEFNTAFRAAVLPDIPLTMRWRIDKAEPKPKMGGVIVELIGDVSDADGKILVEGFGKALVVDQL